MRSLLKMSCFLGMALFMIAPLDAQQSDFEQFQQQQQEAFSDFQDAEENYRQEVTQAYQEYREQQEQAFNGFKERVEEKWEKFRYHSREEFVDYSEDLSTRGSVNFKEGVVEVETVVDKESADTDESAAKENARDKMQEQLKALVEKEDDSGEPMLKDQLRDIDGGTVEKDDADKYATEIATKKPVEQEEITTKDGEKNVKYTMKVKMIPDHLEKRASRFKKEVIEQAKRFDVDPKLAFAVIHTESYFNPKARSHIPAFGLMQLVPSSGARDAYLYVYNEDKLLKADYLYVPKNNIELGCAYLGKMRHRYFKDVREDSTAYYLMIAAYNTGPGNVAKAINGKTQLSPLIETANSHNSEWVKQKLLSDLPYKETKDYLKRVLKRIGMYEALL